MHIIIIGTEELRVWVVQLFSAYLREAWGQQSCCVGGLWFGIMLLLCVCVCVYVFSGSVVSISLQPHGL